MINTPKCELDEFTGVLPFEFDAQTLNLNETGLQKFDPPDWVTGAKVSVSIFKIPSPVSYEHSHLVCDKVEEA